MANYPAIGETSSGDFGDFLNKLDSDSTISGNLEVTGKLTLTNSTLRSCTIGPSGGITPGAGNDLMLNSVNDDSPDQEFIALKVWNAVFNDIADYQPLLDKDIKFGKCYYQTGSGLSKCNERCQKGVIGIASNTFGFGVGLQKNAVPIAIGGWVLAFVDQEYSPGTPLTNDENGNLTEMTLEERTKYPERMLAIYDRLELSSKWGPLGNKVEVKGRHWVKVK